MHDIGTTHTSCKGKNNTEQIIMEKSSRVYYEFRVHKSMPEGLRALVTAQHSLETQILTPAHHRICRNNW